MNEDEIGKLVVDGAVKIHPSVGSGLLETVHEVVLAFELRRRGLLVERQIPISVTYAGFKFEEGFRVDLIVDHKVIVELKSVDRLNNAHKKQLLTYLRLADKRLGYLLNFGAAVMRDGIIRVANRLPPQSHQESPPFSP
jgi:GxxExxY protein